ncbi:MAG: polysaccharide deacetylase family protein [Dehalococcoidales bacterium]|nr:polysaccharide deacetylase family protein [Dehalococcoidales bacterium]
MLSVNIPTENPYVLYGLEHFLFKFGIHAAINQTDTPDIDITNRYDSSNGKVCIEYNQAEIHGAIQSYLKIKSRNIPLFEIPGEINLSGSDRVLAEFAGHANNTPAAISSRKKMKLGFDIFNEIGHILDGQLEPVFALKTVESENIHLLPVVDILTDFLFDQLQILCQTNNIVLETKQFWPKNKKFTLCLTHDVDRIYKTFQYAPSMIRALKKGNAGQLINQVKSLLFDKGTGNPFWNFNRISRLENELGVKSTFFFLRETGKVRPFNLRSWILFAGRYNISHPDVVRVMNELYNDGFDIGLHGSYNSYTNASMLAEEKAEIEKYLPGKLQGIRQHFLNFDRNRTFNIHEEIGLKYDTTLGFNPGEGTGFRRGTSFPFYPYNTETGQSCSILEIPLTVMDGALNTGSELSDCASLMDTIAEYNGVLTLLWHQRLFNEQEFPGMLSLYKRIIEMALEKDAWVSSASAIRDWLVDERVTTRIRTQ